LDKELGIEKTYIICEGANRNGGNMGKINIKKSRIGDERIWIN